MLRSWRSIAVLALAIGVVAALLGQLVQPFHLLTHEFTQALTGATLVIALAIGARLEKTATATDALVASLGATAFLGVGAFGTQMLLNAWVHDCVVSDAVPYFWVTWTPVAVLGSVIGVVLSERGWTFKWLFFAVTMIVLCAASHDGLQFLNGVRIVDPIIGDPQAFSQRGTMNIPMLHVWHRLWLLTAAIAVWVGSRGLRVPVGLLGIAPFLFVTFGVGSHIGVGWGRAALRTALDAELETEHFVFYYGSKGNVSLRIDRIARDGEWHWAELTEAWQIDPSKKVEIRVYEGDKQMKRLTGLSSAHAGWYQIDIPLWDTQSTTFPHELVHALHAELSWNPQLIWIRGMTEGSAVAWAEHFVEVPEVHARQAGALQADKLPSAEDFMSIGGFSKVNEGNAYDASGSFVGFIVLKYGFEKFTKLQQRLDYQGVYGKDLAALDAEWRVFLEEVPVDLAEAATARDSYDPDFKESYREKQCPKLGARGENRKNRAKRMWNDGDYSGAADVYEKLLGETGKTRWARYAAMCLRQLDEHDAIVALTREQLDRDDLDEDQRFQLLQLQLTAHIERDDFDGLYAAYDARAALDDEPTAYRKNVEACLRDEEIREPVMAFLSGRSRDLGRRYIIDLQQEYPDKPALAYLVVARGGVLPNIVRSSYHVSEENWSRIGEAMDFLERSPDACDSLSKRLLELADLGIRIGEYRLTERVSDAVLEHCTDPRARHKATRRLARVEWETTLSSGSQPGPRR